MRRTHVYKGRDAGQQCEAAEKKCGDACTHCFTSVNKIYLFGAGGYIIVKWDETKIL